MEVLQKVQPPVPPRAGSGLPRASSSAAACLEPATHEEKLTDEVLNFHVPECTCWMPSVDYRDSASFPLLMKGTLSSP